MWIVDILLGFEVCGVVCWALFLLFMSVKWITKNILTATSFVAILTLFYVIGRYLTGK